MIILSGTGYSSLFKLGSVVVSQKDVVLKFKTEIYKYICEEKTPENQETDPRMQYNLHEKEMLCVIQ